jgi:diaminopimelate decarboxylase
MLDVIELSERAFGPQEGTLRLSGVSMASLAEAYGTPLFVYDRSSFDKKLKQLRAILPPEFDIYYSIKANPNLAIIRHFVSRGCGLEIASGGELVQALAAGADAARIVFAGPGKTEAELELAVNRKIGELHIESQREADCIAAICRRLNTRARVGVRVNPNADAQGGAMRMGGKSTPFGIDEEKIEPVVDFLSATDVLDFCGLHMSAGTQVLDWQVLAAQYRKAIEIGRRVVQRTGRPLRTIDFGGGLGIPYFDGDRALDLTALGSELERLVTEVRQDLRFTGTRFVIEPGRFLAGEAGIYLARIVDIKESRGKRFLIIDGGMNHHLAASGNLGQTIKRNYPVAVPERLRCPGSQSVDVVGPLCTPLDTLARNVSLPESEAGDLIAVLQSGAYARTASPIGFLSHPSPAEVWVEDGKHYLIRPRGQVEDAVRDVLLPPSLEDLLPYEMDVRSRSDIV